MEKKVICYVLFIFTMEFAIISCNTKNVFFRENAISDKTQINMILGKISNRLYFQNYDNVWFVHSTQKPNDEYDIDKLYYFVNLDSCSIFAFESSVVANENDFIAIIKETESYIFPCQYITDIHQNKGKNELTINVNDTLLQWNELTKGCHTIILNTKNNKLFYDYSYKNFYLFRAKFR
jgi:hypothetical protein